MPHNHCPTCTCETYDEYIARREQERREKAVAIADAHGYGAHDDKAHPNCWDCKMESIIDAHDAGHHEETDDPDCWKCDNYYRTSVAAQSGSA